MSTSSNAERGASKRTGGREAILSSILCGMTSAVAAFGQEARAEPCAMAETEQVAWREETALADSSCTNQRFAPCASSHANARNVRLRLSAIEYTKCVATRKPAAGPGAGIERPPWVGGWTHCVD